jgi:hypothetical protein
MSSTKEMNVLQWKKEKKKKEKLFPFFLFSFGWEMIYLLPRVAPNGRTSKVKKVLFFFFFFSSVCALYQ